MPNHPHMTVIIRANDLLLRADVAEINARQAPKVQLWRQASADMATAVADALKAGGAVGKKVWVLDSSVWLGVVELSAGAVAGLADQALVEPAAFEAEAMSGLPPYEAVTAVQRRRRVNQEDEFLVAQARRTQVIALAKVIRRAGGVLAGLGNPAGLPVPLVQDKSARAAAREGGWRRVCFWADSVVLVECIAGHTTLLPLGVPPHSDWRTLLASVLNQAEPVALEQTLVEPGVQVRGGVSWRDSPPGSGSARWLQLAQEAHTLDPADSAHDPKESKQASASKQAREDKRDGVCHLADDQVAILFAKTWASQLSRQEPSLNGNTMMPTLRAPKTPPGPWPVVAAGVIAFVVAVSGVVWQRDHQAQRLAVVEAELARTVGSRSQIYQKRQLAKDAQQEVRAKKQAIEQLERELKTLNRHVAKQERPVDRRQALALLMGALSSAAAQDVVIHSIDNLAPRQQVVGLATSPEAASRLARELSWQLREAWQVNPAQVEPKQKAGRVVWQFLINLEPVAAASLAKGEVR